MHVSFFRASGSSEAVETLTIDLKIRDKHGIEVKFTKDSTNASIDLADESSPHPVIL
jgi:hypothetical protein